MPRTKPNSGNLGEAVVFALVTLGLVCREAGLPWCVTPPWGQAILKDQLLEAVVFLRVTQGLFAVRLVCRDFSAPPWARTRVKGKLR